MAKVRMYKLSWRPSASENIIGYKLYWSKEGTINHDSDCTEVGNTTEITLPPDITFSGRPVLLGVAAVDEEGNESDIAMIASPYLFQMPDAPVGLSLTALDDFRVIDTNQSESMTLREAETVDPALNEDDNSLAEAIASHGSNRSARMKYYDDVGYRKVT